MQISDCCRELRLARVKTTDHTHRQNQKSNEQPKSLFSFLSLVVAKFSASKADVFLSHSCLTLKAFPASHFAFVVFPFQLPLLVLPSTLPFFLSPEGAWAYWLSKRRGFRSKRQNASLRGSHDGWLNAFCSRPEGFLCSRSQLVACYSSMSGCLNPVGRPFAL